VNWAVPLVVAAAVAVTGCGGGGGAPLTKAEFIKRGDAICTKYRKKNRELNEKAPAKNPTDPSATDEQVKASAPILETLANNLRSARDEFAALEPPADVKSDWQNTLDDLDQISSKLDDAAAAARDLDRQRVVNEYAEILRLNRRVSTFETDYGFTVCGTSA
jgi:acyl-CoA reductase-like NAD-dependent aldehyde dehydrogenase